MLYLRVPQIMPCLSAKGTKAPVYCIITTMERKSAVCSLYGGCRGTATVLMLESIVRHYVSVSKSRFAIFKRYNVNNVKLNS